MPNGFLPPPSSDLVAIMPQLIVAVLAMVVLLADAIAPKMSKRALANISILGLLLALVVQALQRPGIAAQPVLQNMVITDQYAWFFNIVFLIGALLSVLLSVDYLEREGISHGEYYALLMLSTVGMMIMGAAMDLIIVFLGLEVLSISLYILAGYARDSRVSEEAGLKYFLLGAFASAFFLYGVALVYGATQSTNLIKIASEVKAGGVNPLLLAGAAMLVVGFGFKVAVVPFHVWTPDVYEGAPTSVTAFMSVGAKAAGFAAFLRVFSMALPGLHEESARVVAILAALTMVVGNFIAVVQQNIKRILAYSSIAHAGYIMVGMVAALHPASDANRQEAIAAVLFYTLAYTVTNLGAFAVVLAFRRVPPEGRVMGEEVLDLDDYAGLGLKYPALGAAMTLFMVSLAGLPPTAGFLGKLYLFRAALGAGRTGLVIVGVLTSVVSVYYYLAVIVRMYMTTPSPAAAETEARPAGHLSLALALTAALTLLLGIVPGRVLDQAQNAWNAFQQSVARL